MPPYTTLIDAPTLAALLGSPGVVVIDCRFDLRAPEWGETQYLERHVAGAVYAHLDRDLSGAKSGTNGRHPLPSPDALVETFNRLGIDNGTQVIAYDQDTGMYASRLWWLLRWMGHEAVAVLDGGFAAWRATDGATASGAEQVTPAAFAARRDDRLLATLQEVQARLGDPSLRLIDARAGERYRGEVEPLDRVAGHIPGAANRFFQENLRDGRFRSVEELRAAFEEVLGPVPPDAVVSYCGSGVTGCHNLLAMEHAGLRGGRLYPGSWSEWCADPDRPIERG